MSLSYTVPSSLEYFACLVQSDEHFPLLEAAVSLAQDEYPELDVEQVLGEVDQLLARLKRRLPPDASALQKLRVLNQFFFRDLNFGGNVNDYYDPDNSFLHAVFRTRKGIPISLAVICALEEFVETSRKQIVLYTMLTRMMAADGPID